MFEMSRYLLFAFAAATRPRRSCSTVGALSKFREYFLLRLALEPDVVIADHFERMMKGLGTDEKELSAAVIRYHGMQPRVERLYEKMYGRSLEKRIRTDTDANYGDLLITLLYIPTDDCSSSDGNSNSNSEKEPETAS
ncbi:hypothetical protein JG687_00008597 [Phytophthora cactorum]|uniref:Annexin repeat n=2 Tax=Phytophthora cactorum TaxID=29920 RepID=A0A8T1UF41_9STRA|nr:hypothetical protein Pcac1_g12575 [Phytophthora cactorum]KAG2977211.1 hypothetical protein PC118_g13012 [Phytophthora cactorum]KAG3087075.1 hypothetical protein PC121_g4755 [Phytophthora cactorum]KAG6959758.1 hypothetical protein JG687_00008597 [Phytophthora cactorum]